MKYKYRIYFVKFDFLLADLVKKNLASFHIIS